MIRDHRRKPFLRRYISGITAAARRCRFLSDILTWRLSSQQVRPMHAWKCWKSSKCQPTLVRKLRSKWSVALVEPLAPLWGSMMASSALTWPRYLMLKDHPPSTQPNDPLDIWLSFHWFCEVMIDDPKKYPHLLDLSPLYWQHTYHHKLNYAEGIIQVSTPSSGK